MKFTKAIPKPFQKLGTNSYNFIIPKMKPHNSIISRKNCVDESNSANALLTAFDNFTLTNP